MIIDDGDATRRERRIAALAREIERLDGMYITAQDVGTTTADMDLVPQYTRHVVGCSWERGLEGDLSLATARTVLGGIQAALDVLDGDDRLEGRSVGVIGLGKVGGHLARLPIDAGAHVAGFDTKPGQTVRSAPLVSS